MNKKNIRKRKGKIEEDKAHKGEEERTSSNNN